MIMLIIIAMIIPIIVYCKYRLLSADFLLRQSFQTLQRSLLLPTQDVFSKKVRGFILREPL